MARAHCRQRSSQYRDRNVLFMRIGNSVFCTQSHPRSQASVPFTISFTFEFQLFGRFNICNDYKVPISFLSFLTLYLELRKISCYLKYRQPWSGVLKYVLQINNLCIGHRHVVVVVVVYVWCSRKLPYSIVCIFGNVTWLTGNNNN